MPPVSSFYRCLGDGKRIPSAKIGDGIVSKTAQCSNVYTHHLLFCFLFQVDCDDASDERSLVTIVQRDEMAADDEEDPIEETIADMREVNKANGIVVEEKVDGGGGLKERRDVVEQQQPTIVVANKGLVTGQPPSSSCDCYGFDDGDLPGIILFGKLLKKLFFDKIPDGMFYLGVLASKKIADESRKFVKERARNTGTTLCGFTKQRLRDFFWLEEARPNNNEERGAVGDIPVAAIELTEKPLMKRKKIKVKRVAAVAANKSTTITTDTEKVAKGSTETLPPLPIGSSSSDEDE